MKRTQRACELKTPAKCLPPVGTWWVGLFSAKELRLYPGLLPRSEPQAHGRVCLPLEALEEEEEAEEKKEEEEQEGEREGGGGGLNWDPGWCPIC